MFELKNKDVSKVYQLLYEMDLPLRLNRKRAVFMSKIQEHFMGYYENGKNELIEKYAKHDSEGKLIPHEKGGVEIEPNNLEILQEEMNILDNETYQMDTNDVNKQLLESIYEIVMTDKYVGSLKGDMALIHATLCDELERVLEK